MAALNISDMEGNLFTIVQVIKQLISGRSNATGRVRLRTGQTTTVVDRDKSNGAFNVAKDSQIFLFPRTAHAAAIVASVFVADADILNGQFTITHPSSVNTDLDYHWMAVG